MKSDKDKYITYMWNLKKKKNDTNELISKTDSDIKNKLFFLGLHWQHIKVLRLGVKLEQQLPPYATAPATLDLSHVCDIHHSSQQHQIFDPLSEARD